MITASVYLGTLRAHWRMLLALAGLGLLIGLLGVRLLPSQYIANRLLVVTAQGGQGLTDLSQGSSLATGHAQSLTYIGNTQATLYRAMNSIGADPAASGSYKIQAAMPANTTYVEIHAQGPAAESAIALAKAASERLITANGELTSALADTSKPAVAVRDVTASNEQDSASPAGPSRTLLALGATALLPLLAFFVLALRGAVKPRAGESFDLDELIPYKTLGSIRGERGAALEVVRPRPSHFAVLRRAGLIESGVGGRIITLARVDGPSDPRTALALAQALAELDRSVLVVDADMASPTLDPSATGGLAQCIESGRVDETYRRRWLDSTIEVLPTGRAAGATRLLISSEAREVFETLREEYDVILISSASALSGPGASAVASLSDEVIILADFSTPVDLIVDAGQSFPNNLVSGVVVLGRGSRRDGWHAGARPRTSTESTVRSST